MKSHPETDVDTYESLNRVFSTRIARRLGVALACSFVAFVAAAALLPWQQAVYASGKVSAVNPAERPLDLQAPTSGRPAFWYPNIEEIRKRWNAEGDPVRDAEFDKRVQAALAAFRNSSRVGSEPLPLLAEELRKQGLIDGGTAAYALPTLGEGSFVRTGQPLLELEDVNADYLKVLQEKSRLAEKKSEAALAALRAEREALKEEKAARDFAVGEAKETVAAGESKVRALRNAVRAEEEKLRQYDLKYQRYVKLETAAVVSTQEFEAVRQEFQSQRAYLAKAQADLDAEISDLASKREKLGKTQRDADAKIADRKSKVEKAEGETAFADKDKQDADNAFARQRQQTVIAPGDGVVMRLLRNQPGQLVAAGEAVARFVPEAKTQAAELYLDGNDQALVKPGDHVRLQFEGWPAIQFSGWPNVAVGTFGGRVLVVDPADELGKFRVLVEPSRQFGLDENWPEPAVLRQGVAVNGWVLIRRVSLGWEIWRRLNGFPPSRDHSPKEQTPKSAAKPKFKS